MIVIEERKSSRVPGLTSLYFKLTIYDEMIYKSIIQQPVFKQDKITHEFEFPLNRLFFLVKLFIKKDDVEFRPFNEPKKVYNKVDPNKFKVKLYQHQLEGVEYGLNHNGWMLLDDQGLGKTCQMICLAQELKEREHIEHCMIICGVNTLKYTWAEEISKFSDLDYTILGQVETKTGKKKILSVAERIKILEGNIKEFFVITNLETLQSSDFAKAFKKSKTKFGMIVLDEAHKVKSPSSKSSKTLLKLITNHNIALTGTMIMNEPDNAFMPLKWTGNLDCNFTDFKNVYDVFGGFSGHQIVGVKNMEMLKQHIDSCSIRRLKSEVLDLPERTFKKEYVEMGTAQRQLYDNVSSSISSGLSLLTDAQKLSTIKQEIVENMRLRQITAYPGMLTTEDIPSAKLDRMEDLVEEIIGQGNKVVIYSSFKGTVPEIERRLCKYKPLVCTGDQKEDEIDTNKELFQNDDSRKVLIATWQKMGTGFTLTKASYVIFIDTPWTSAEFKQCADRVYRIGQSKNVCIITLITKDTYDERVQEILDRKENLETFILDHKDTVVEVEDYNEYLKEKNSKQESYIENDEYDSIEEYYHTGIIDMYK